MSLDIYTTTSMLAVLRSLRRTPSFLLDTFFPGYIQSDDEEIKFDVEIDNVQIAPFVSPLAKAPTMRDDGQRTDTFKPAYVKPKHRIDPSRVLRRMMGEAIGGSLTPAEREQAHLASRLYLQQNMILRRKEVMASEALRLSTNTVVGDQYPTTVVDFGRDAALSVALANGSKWTDNGVSPVDALDDYVNTVGTKSGAAPNVCTMDAKAWKAYSNDPKLDRKIDRTLGQNDTVKISQQNGEPGTAVYKGRVDQVDIYVYNDTYEDVDGTTKQLLPDFTVILGAVAALEGSQAHGAILDPKAGFQPFEIFPKSWIEEDPAVRWAMSQSAPLVVPKRPNASMRVTVG